jgi:hypothetical protein
MSYMTTTPTLADLAVLATAIRAMEARPCPEDECPATGPEFRRYLAACDAFATMADSLHRCREAGCGDELCGPDARTPTGTGYCDRHHMGL